MSVKRLTALVSAVVFMSMSVLSAAAQTAPAAAAGPRLALVVGNGAYAANPLQNPPNDAEDLAAALRDSGFQVTLLKNADLTTFEAAVGTFAAGLKGADTGLFYYAGHGVQVDGMNFMIPTAPRIDDAASVKAKAVAVDTVVAKMEASGVRTALLFLDSCRDNPFPGAGRSGLRGLAVVPTPKTVNSLISYAISPVDTASDGAGRNGVFSGAVLKYLAEPGLELGVMMRQVKAEVAGVTANKQQPRVDDGMKESFYFVSPDMAAARAKLVADKTAAELAALEAQIAEREKAITAAKDAKVRQELEIAQQTAKALENVKRLASESAAETERTAKEAARKADDDAARLRLSQETAAKMVALRIEAEAKQAEYEGLDRATDNAEGYLRQIGACDTALKTIEARYAQAIKDAETNIRQTYVIKEAELGIQPWESEREFQTRIDGDKSRLASALGLEITASTKKLEAEMALAVSGLLRERQAVESGLIARTWTVAANQLTVSFGAFDRNKKGWPVTIKLLNSDYKAEVFYDITGSLDLRTAFTAVDNTIKASAFAAEMDYSLAKRASTDLYIATIKTVRVIDLTNNITVASRSAAQSWYAVKADAPDKKIYTGQLTITSDPSGATVNIDGKASGRTPLTLVLNAGEHEVTLPLEYSGYLFRGISRSVVDPGTGFSLALSGSTIKLTFVEGGTFRRESNDITVSSFYMGTYEVTQDEYQRVMGANPSCFTGDGKRPVEQVSWYDAAAFCNALSKLEGLDPAYTINGTDVAWNSGANGYRLPTEAEWEYAARGGKQSKGYDYAGSADVNAVGWYSSNSGNQTKPVGTKAANELGIYDLSGNVWEWCWDLSGGYLNGDQTNPTGASSGAIRGLRGGSWDYDALNLRTVTRTAYYPATRNITFGFRVLLPQSSQIAYTVSPGNTTSDYAGRAVVDFGTAVSLVFSGSTTKLTFVEGGSFLRESNDVAVSSFYMGTYEVTQDEYQRAMGANPSYFTGDGKRPVEQVSWYDAAAFCNALSKLEGLNPAYAINGTDVAWNSGADGYRLPTEAEWEYAASGGIQSKGYEYAGSADVNAVGWYSNNSGSQTKPVGTKVANEQGIYDLLGNVYEWCWDWYGEYPDGSQTDPTGAFSGTCRVLRGGSFRDDERYLRSANRYNYYPDNRYHAYGFRVLLPQSGK